MKGGAIVVLNIPSLIGLGKSGYVELGPVLDISMGGLAVQYIDNKKRQADCLELSISLPPEGHKLEKIPFEIVSDVVVAQLPDAKVIRKRCVQFGELNSYQSFQLESFIKEYATTIIKDRRSGLDRRHFNDPQFEDEAFRATHEKRFMGERRQSA